MSEHKRYIGDSVYADFDGYNIILTTENSDVPSNRIILEPDVMDHLNEYVNGLKERYQKIEEE